MRLLSCVFAILAVPAVAGAASRALDPADPGWTLRGDVRVERIDGAPAFVFGSGQAYFKNIAFEGGVIAFELRTTPRRTFIGLRFRAASEGRFEEIYFRPHKTGLPDAVQYAPAFAGGRSQWQLYHGAGDTAAAGFPHGDWLQVRIVVRDRRAAVFLGGSTAPAMIVDRLALDPSPGFVGFWSFDADESPATQATSVRNIVVSGDAGGYAFPPAAAARVPEGVLREWEVSSPFAAPEGAVQSLPPDVTAGAWRRAETEPDGLLAFDRVVTPPAGVRRATVIARTAIEAPAARTARVEFGFSDDVSVFLNGRLIYSGVHGYSFNFPRRDGLITIDQASLYLPLQAGRNELMFAVSDSFGGWGLQARVVPDHSRKY